jgi:hypothetical protein
MPFWNLTNRLRPNGGVYMPIAALRWLRRERRSIDEHSMHDDGELAGERHDTINLRDDSLPVD